MPKPSLRKRLNPVIRTTALLLVSWLILPGLAHLQLPSRSAALWRELTLADLQEAHAILARNHPGAAAATGDTAFRRMLASGLTESRRRAEQVQSYEGWLATLRAFAVGFDDPHISLRPRLVLDRVRWPGFVVARQGDETIVAARDSTESGLPALGSRLQSCDGTPVEALNRTRLGLYRGTWDVPAQRVQNAPLFLVDDGNPFLPVLTRCIVSEQGVERTIDLRWRAIASTTLQPRLRDAAPAGRAGFVVRRVGRGWWIGMESMSDRFQPVLDSVRANLAAIRSAAWVVVDVRGNGGGSSEWGRRLAELLTGDRRTAAAMRRAEGPRCGGSWRASSDVEETIAGYIRDLGPQLGPRIVDEWRAELDSVRAARSAGRELAPEPTACPKATAGGPEPALPASLMAGRLVLLTDHVCFSSCLLMPPLFRALGALHLGEGTDFSTRYMEVRGFPLPSGLGSFYTLQKVAFDASRRLGPFDPDTPFPGRMDDTAGLEAWIRNLLER